MPFDSYLKEINKLGDDEFVSELKGGLEECRRKGLNKLNTDSFRALANTLGLISNTNVNRKLLFEKLYWEVKENRK
jgi:hypothetical protein